MTKVAIERLPQEQLGFIGTYRSDLVSTYCLIPDLEKKDPNWSPYIDSFLSSYKLTEVPEGRERSLLHVAYKSETNLKIYEYYTKTICEKYKSGDLQETSKYIGTFLHFIEDTSCPAHMRYGAYQRPLGEKERMPYFSSLPFFKRFMPVPEKYQNARLHGLIDEGGFSEIQLREHIGDYQPILLGNDLVAAVDIFKARHEQMMAETDKMLIPMLQARFNEDEEKFAEYGLNAAEPSVKLAADFMYTILKICSNADSSAEK
jgi:hypothetical protein